MFKKAFTADEYLADLESKLKIVTPITGINIGDSSKSSTFKSRSRSVVSKESKLH